MKFPPNEWQWRDSAGVVMPWFTRPMLDVLQWIQHHGIAAWRVFEWGAGYSTLWWARYTLSVFSVEAESEWTRDVNAALEADPDLRASLKPRAKVMHIPESDMAYPRSVAVVPELLYDCIVIDGSQREACAVEAFRNIKPGGIIILDNSDQHPEVFRIYRHNEHHTFPQPGHPNWTTTYWRMTEFGTPPESPTVAAVEQQKRRGTWG